MPPINMRQIDEFDTMIGDFIEGTRALTSSLGVRLLNYMKIETMADIDDVWKDLERVYFDSFDYNDTYYMPMRRRVSPD